MMSPVSNASEWYVTETIAEDPDRIKLEYGFREGSHHFSYWITRNDKLIEERPSVTGNYDNIEELYCSTMEMWENGEYGPISN